jgi:hypothetical protein
MSLVDVTPESLCGRVVPMTRSRFRADQAAPLIANVWRQCNPCNSPTARISSCEVERERG